MKIAICQPHYLPWLGYFRLAHEVDHFVFYDDVQFSRQSWQQRNRIFNEHKAKNVWLTIPIASSHTTPINKVQIAGKEWTGEHWRKIQETYRQPFDQADMRALASIYERIGREDNLIAVTIPLFKYLFFHLKLNAPIWHLSSELGVKGGQTGRLVNICRYLGATEYLSPVGSKAYLDESQFEKYGIKVSYLYIEPPHYYSTLHSLLTIGAKETGDVIDCMTIHQQEGDIVTTEAKIKAVSDPVDPHFTIRGVGGPSAH